MSDPKPLAPHTLQTAVATMVERLLIEASLPAKGKDPIKRHLAREQLATIVGSLTMRDLPDDTDQCKALSNFNQAPQQTKIWGGYLGQ